MPSAPSWAGGQLSVMKPSAFTPFAAPTFVRTPPFPTPATSWSTRLTGDGLPGPALPSLLGWTQASPSSWAARGRPLRSYLPAQQVWQVNDSHAWALCTFGATASVPDPWAPACPASGCDRQDPSPLLSPDPASCTPFPEGQNWTAQNPGQTGGF